MIGDGMTDMEASPPAVSQNVAIALLEEQSKVQYNIYLLLAILLVLLLLEELCYWLVQCPLESEGVFIMIPSLSPHTGCFHWIWRQCGAREGEGWCPVVHLQHPGVD